MNDDFGWTSRHLGDNNSFDHFFLLRLYSCGTLYESIDKTLASLRETEADLSDESFVSQSVISLEADDRGDEHDPLGDLVELLRDNTGVGNQIRSLLPSCPQCKFALPLITLLV